MSYEDTKHLRIFWGAMLIISALQIGYIASEIIGFTPWQPTTE